MEHVTAVLNSVMDLVPVCQEILVKQEVLCWAEGGTVLG